MNTHTKLKRKTKVEGSEKKLVVIEQLQTLPDDQKIVKMKELYKDNPPTIGMQAPTSSKLIEVKVDGLVNSTLPQYQRGYEHSRTERIVNSIIRFGHMGASVITIVKKRNGDLFMHDGRHRLLALYILDIPTSMANIVQFRNQADEIDYFNMINESQRPLTPEQRLLNNFQANNPLALLIYDLGYLDTNSKWHDKVALSGCGNKSGKLSVANFRKIVNWAGLGLRRRMEGESDVRALRRWSNTEYSIVLQSSNRFHDWYYEMASTPHFPGDVYTKDKVLISLLEFYYCSYRQDSSKAVLQPERILTTAAKKFKSFPLDILQSYDASKAPTVLFEHFNGKGAKKRANPVEQVGM